MLPASSPGRARWLRLLAPLFVGALLCVAGFPALATSSSAGAQANATAECPRLIVPAYFSPGPEWERTIAAASLVEYVILNPNSGPGLGPDPAFQDVVWRAQQAGIKVLGYVFTDLGAADPEVVKEQIRAYQAWYGVDGIHLDGVQNIPEFIPYYADLAEVIRAGGQPASGGSVPGVVMLNPGFVPDEGYMEIADIIEVYEWFYERYPGQEFPDWIYDYPAERFAHVVYEVPV
jgi:hypothetical protein